MNKKLLLTFSAAWLAVLAMPSFAGTAPVYDADAMIPYGNPSDEADILPEPPADTPAYVSASPSAQEIWDSSPNAANPVKAPTLAQKTYHPPLTLAERLKRIEQQVKGVQSANAAPKVDSLQNQVQVLRNQVEQLTHQLEQVKSQQKLLYSDLDERLIQSENTAKQLAKAARKALPPKKKPEVVATKKKEVEIQPGSAEEQKIYQEAYNLIKAKKYSQAVKSLKGMLKKYPSGQFASNAHYWLGELYGLLGNNRQSLNEFESVINDFPDSSRVSDAQLKIGLIYASQANWGKAKLAFNTVTSKYSGTASARLAKEQLNQIKQAGH